MAPSDSEYDIISPFTLPAQTDNNNDIPVSSLSSRINTVNFDDNDSCVVITETPIDDGDLDDCNNSDFDSPSSPVRTRSTDQVRANGAGMGPATTTTTTTTSHTGPHYSHDFKYPTHSPPCEEAYEENAVSSTHNTAGSSPEVAASTIRGDGRSTPNSSTGKSSNVHEGRSSSTTAAARTFHNLLSTVRIVPRGRRGNDVPSLLPPLPKPGVLAAGLGAEAALSREIAVGESSFSRGAMGALVVPVSRSPRKTQGGSEPSFAASLKSLHR